MEPAVEPVAAHDTPTEAAEAVSGNGSDASTDYASSDDGGFPFADEEHVDHYGTGALEGTRARARGGGAAVSYLSSESNGGRARGGAR